MNIPTLDVTNGFWVFGYGSLVWQPGFDFAEKEIARDGRVQPQFLHVVDPSSRYGC